MGQLQAERGLQARRRPTWGKSTSKIYTYVRYLNQKGLDGGYTDHFGATIRPGPPAGHPAQQGEHPVPGLAPGSETSVTSSMSGRTTRRRGRGRRSSLRGTSPIRSASTSRWAAASNSLPGTDPRGSFPFWLTNDNRYIADEFFRPPIPWGCGHRGTVVDGLTYSVMLGNNLSQLGVDADSLTSTPRCCRFRL
ncbi:MAG: hypothetical protein MZU97_07075 [Bacillus subtilis]|nr:hypothetical protein [Bacillus subtilis]